MLPNIIVIDQSGPYNGADIHANYMVVRERNKHKVINGLRMFMPDIKFEVMTKKEYIDANPFTETKKEKTNSNKR